MVCVYICVSEIMFSKTGSDKKNMILFNLQTLKIKEKERGENINCQRKERGKKTKGWKNCISVARGRCRTWKGLVFTSFVCDWLG